MAKIARVYQSEQAAQSAASKLKDNGFGQSLVVLTPADAGSSSTAKGYGKYLSAGQSVVEVDPAFGKAAGAKDIMQEFGPLDENPTVARTPARSSTKSSSSSSSNVTEVHAEQGPAPLSHAFGWKTLRQNDPTPMSDKWGWETQKSGFTFGEPPVSNSYTTGAFGLISNNPAPFSSMFGLRLKSGVTDGSWSQSFGRDLLIRNNPTPLSDKWGLTVLSRKG